SPPLIAPPTPAFKSCTPDSAAALFLFEHRHTGGKKGGPPSHLHRNEDEWFRGSSTHALMSLWLQRFVRFLILAGYLYYVILPWILKKLLPRILSALSRLFGKKRRIGLRN